MCASSTGRRAAVTGGSKGAGATLVRRLRQDGAPGHGGGALGA